MQSYGELKHQIKTLNELLFGRGFYYFWCYDCPKSMQQQVSQKKKGDTLLIEVSQNTLFKPVYEIYLKKCKNHTLPKDFYIPDHWTKAPLEIIETDFAAPKDNEDDRLVKSFSLKLHSRPFNDENDYYFIEAESIYFKKLFTD